MTYLLAIDQGTTNSRAIIFNHQGELQSQHDLPLTQAFPQPGWVEQDAEEMFDKTLQCCHQALKKAKLKIKELAALGISNQRETTILWDKKTGKPIYPAIVWQDRRTAALCQKFASHPINALLQEKTGLLLDPYFSATKIVWILDHVPGARQRAEKGELLFGTVDTYLIWRLTKGQSHVTDVTNASRTLLFNLKTQSWDQEILAAFNLPAVLLPEVLDNVAHFGDVAAEFLGGVLPIAGVAGDQQAAAIGQACFEPGMLKATYGTGAFLLLNTGSQFVQSKNRLLTTIAYRLNQKVCYALEGSIFSAGTTIKWLRDTLGLIASAGESEVLAKEIDNTEGVYLVPAFTGLGAPYWDPHARGAILGLTRNSGRAQLVRAALESVAYQTRDLIEAMLSDEPLALKQLRVDGGMVANQWLMQFLADMLQIDLEQPPCFETSALGAAYLAGLGVGVYQSLAEISQHKRVTAVYKPKMREAERAALYQGWKLAIKRVSSSLSEA